MISSSNKIRIMNKYYIKLCGQGPIICQFVACGDMSFSLRLDSMVPPVAHVSGSPQTDKQNTLLIDPEFAVQKIMKFLCRQQNATKKNIYSTPE